ncbi:hypothetical protein [Haladaptatus halobius]
MKKATAFNHFISQVKSIFKQRENATVTAATAPNANPTSD